MSDIRVRHNTATVDLEGDQFGIQPNYNPDDLMVAVLATLRAIPGPQANQHGVPTRAVQWIDAIRSAAHTLDGSPLL